VDCLKTTSGAQDLTAPYTTPAAALGNILIIQDPSVLDAPVLLQPPSPIALESALQALLANGLALGPQTSLSEIWVDCSDTLATIDPLNIPQQLCLSQASLAHAQTPHGNIAQVNNT